MIEMPRSNHPGSQPDLNIKVVGLGGAGSNALDRIQLDGLDRAELIAMNTDSQSLAASVAPQKVQLGRDTTRGLGTGGDPELGYAAAEEAAGDIRSALEGASMVFICAGLGGGTGSGAAPLIANFARQQGALVVAFVTVPFAFEGRRRLAQAEETIASLRQQADVLICFENDKISDLVNPRAGIQEAFAAADQVISDSVRAVTAILQRRGIIHVGFDELAATLRSQHSRSLFGIGEAEGDNRAHAALERALRSPLMDRGRLLADAQSVLVQIAGGATMTLNEVTVLMDELNRHINDTTRLFFSTAVDPKLGNKMSVTILSSLGTPPASAEAPVRTAVAARPAAAVAAPIVPTPAPAPVAPPAPAPAPEPIPAEPELPVEAIAPEPDLAPVYIPSPEPIRIVVPPVEATPAPSPSVPLAPAATAEAEVDGTAGSADERAAKTARAAARAKIAREEKQEQMLFEPVNRGRFEKSEPTIIDGQDLDVPAFMRMNIRVK